MSTPVDDKPIDKGSRDKVRILMSEAGQKLYEALIEIGKLQEHNKKRLEYKRTNAYLGIALNHIELARVEMRKRKRKERHDLATVALAEEKPEVLEEVPSA